MMTSVSTLLIQFSQEQQKQPKKTNRILSSPGQHHPRLPQNIVSVIIPSAISFSVISTVAISCRLLRLRIAFYTKFIFYSARADVIVRITSSISVDVHFPLRSFAHTYPALSMKAVDDTRLPNDAKQLQRFPLNRHFFA